MFLMAFLKNVILGFVHSYFNYNYSLKIFILLGVETVLFFIHVAMAVRNLVIVQSSHWVIIWCSILRIMIVTSFYLDYST